MPRGPGDEAGGDQFLPREMDAADAESLDRDLLDARPRDEQAVRAPRREID
jgi:hypothetical protein